MIKYLVDFQKKVAVPASIKLGSPKYIEAAFGSALEIEGAQKRYKNFSLVVLIYIIIKYTI